MRNIDNEIKIQREYYAQTATLYDDLHLNRGDEHFRAMQVMFSFLEMLEIKSVLDIGSGTGRVLVAGKRQFPQIKFVGIEPSANLRDIAYLKGIGKQELVDGDAQKLDYPDNSFDLVCEFGALHHVPRPDLAVSETLRVAKKAIFISDSNNFGEGSYLARTLKQILRALGLWKMVDLVKTKGKGYRISEEDGLSYSYSVFDNYRQISDRCSEILTMNTKGKAINIYRDTFTVALLGMLK